MISRMFHAEADPKPPLSDYIQKLWYFSGILGTSPRERVLPDGSMNVVLDLRGSGSVASGAHSEYFVIDTALDMQVMGIWFKPGGAFPFFTMPASELRDTHTDLADVWGASANEMRERILAAPTMATKFDAVERVLLDRLAHQREHHPAVHFALNKFGDVSTRIAAVTDAIGLSSRYFAQLFSEEVGLTPKVFCRVRRFQRVLHLINNCDHEIDWIDVALSCGYYDQSHFIHDFQSFSGINPTEYVTRGSRHINHVPMDS